jgi:uncharacterized lipoprotein
MPRAAGNSSWLHAATLAVGAERKTCTNSRDTTKILIVAATFVGGYISGCAPTTYRIDVHYKQQTGVAQIAGTGNISVNVHVTDQRQDTRKVNSKKNAFGMEMDPIIAAKDVPVTIRRTIEQGHRARRFQIGLYTARMKISADLGRLLHKVLKQIQI